MLFAAEAGAGDEALAEARALQRRAQWRLDFVVAENSMVFHASPEAARLLAEATDYARQGQIAVLRLFTLATAEIDRFVLHPPPFAADEASTASPRPLR